MREQGKGCSGLPASLAGPMSGLSLSGAPGLGAFPCCVFVAHGHSFPQCGGVRASSWRQPGRKEVSGASALGSWVAPGPVELLPKADLQPWGVCHVCFSLLVNQALHKSLEELPLMWRGGQAALAWFFLFTSLFYHAAQLLCSCPSTSCDHFRVGTRVTLFTNCCNVRL